MKWILPAFVPVLFLTSFSCNKKKPLGPQVINYSIFFIIRENGQRLPDSVLDQMKLAYYQNGSKKYMTDFIRGINEGGFDARSMGVQTTRDIGVTSGDEGIKNYFLEYPDGSEDSLFVDYRHVSYEEAVNNSCFCYYPLVSIKFNGQTPALDSSITLQRVYIFKKP